MSTSRVPVVGVTGSLGSGKSEVGQIFAGLGARVVDADALAREVVQPGTAGLAEVAAHFGVKFLTPAGELDRKALGAVVFADADARSALEAILHPKIRALFLERLRALQSTHPLSREPIVYLVPLLFESKFDYPEFDAIVVVSAPREVCLARTMARDRCSREAAEARYDAQLPIAEKEAQADYVIRNDGTRELLQERAEAVWAQLKRLLPAEGPA